MNISYYALFCTVNGKLTEWEKVDISDSSFQTIYP